MKNKIGVISGFVAGLVGFLLLFKVIVLDRTSPEDELAPGMVIILAIMAGAAFAFIGSWVQNYFAKERNV